jgi:DNA-binding CsgD family transcriptional regulator
LFLPRSISKLIAWSFSMGVSEAEYLASLDLIHEAALEPTAWGKVLRQLAKLTNCTAGGLTVENPQTGEGAPLVYFGFDENHVEKTFAYYLPMNPLFRIAPLMRPGFIVTNGDVVPTDEFRRTEFYDGWARPQQLCSPLTLVLHRDESVYCPLTLVRPDGTGEATADDRALLERLAPHLIRAMRVSMQLELARRGHFALEATLTRIAIAVLLLDRRKRVVFANPAAERLLASGGALTTLNGALAARAARSNQQLQKAILEVIGQKRGAGAELSIEREGGRPLLATVFPIAPASPFLPLLEGAACCAVFVSDPDSVQASRASAIAHTYGLTPAEARLLDLILSGAGTVEAARGLGVSLATARTHLAHIFSKTGTKRQGELINLVMTSTPPLWGDHTPDADL